MARSNKAGAIVAPTDPAALTAAILIIGMDTAAIVAAAKRHPARAALAAGRITQETLAQYQGLRTRNGGIPAAARTKLASGVADTLAFTPPATGADAWMQRQVERGRVTPDGRIRIYGGSSLLQYAKLYNAFLGADPERQEAAYNAAGVNLIPVALGGTVKVSARPGTLSRAAAGLRTAIAAFYPAMLKSPEAAAAFRPVGNGPGLLTETAARAAVRAIIAQLLPGSLPDENKIIRRNKRTAATAPAPSPAA